MPAFIIFIIGLIRWSDRVRRRNELRDAKEAADAAVRAERWEAASESERQATVRMVKHQQDMDARARTARRQSILLWLLGIVVVFVLAAVVTVFEVWHFVFLAAFIGCVLGLLHSEISSAVADGIRKGKQS